MARAYIKNRILTHNLAQKLTYYLLTVTSPGSQPAVKLVGSQTDHYPQQQAQDAKQ